jgi:hypothetical protein
MESEIKRIYIGLPQALINKVFWVARPYRTNPLSHIEGGIDIVMEYRNGKVLGYDWIKCSTSYIYAIFGETVDNYNDDNDFEDSKDDKCFASTAHGKSLESNIRILKSIISAIYIRKFETYN